MADHEFSYVDDDEDSDNPEDDYQVKFYFFYFLIILYEGNYHGKNKNTKDKKNNT